MPRSMTGFGRGEAIGHGKKFTVELKSVNHRFAEVVLRMPKQFFSLEEKAKRVILERVARGRVDGFVSVEQLEEKIPTVKVDKALASSYYKAMGELLAELKMADPIRVDHILALPGVVSVESPQEDADQWWPALEQAIRSALDGLVAMREAEGNRLREDLLDRLGRIEKMTSEIEARAPLVAEEYRARLIQRLSEWLADATLDMDRVMAEVVIFAEKSSITEEIVRLYSHIGQAGRSFGGNDPVGRKLDFIIQEMYREINTIASKSGDVLISGLVVEAKSELEKIREQVQNLE
ncbi:MAG: YicC family protein [Peptococcaceae bacterium]|nr:YicC family protein [Peptococcaceae bacterium]